MIPNTDVDASNSSARPGGARTLVTSRVRALLPSILLVIGSTYLALLVSEVALWRHSLSVSIVAAQRGMYMSDPAVGVVHKPGFETAFDDGHARGRIRINSLGDRDDEPRGSPASRVLLLGDSFTFGELLDQSRKIDNWIERQLPGIDAYNLGVTGYNLPEQLGALQRTTVAARHVVYLFFPNDFAPPADYIVLDGYRFIAARAPDGKRLPDAQQRAVLAQKLANVRAWDRSNSPWQLPPLRSLLLPRLRALIWLAMARVRRTGSAPHDGFEPSNRAQIVARSVESTLEIRTLARQRGMGFQVVIIPTVEEARAGAHSNAVAQYIAKLRSAGIQPMDLLPRLNARDYWQHDGHFDESGAKIAGEAIARDLPAALKRR
jgi:hypothetical protein